MNNKYIKLYEEFDNSEKIFSDIKQKIWYHGRTVKTDIFSYDYVGLENSINQEGVGFYFTNSLNDAYRYANDGVVLECKINYRKSKLTPQSGTPSKWVIEKLIKKSPQFEDTLSNFGENLNDAYHNAFEIYMDNNNPLDAYLTIWADFYSKSPKEYLENISWFYDGHLVKKDDNIYHLIIYNPELIKVKNKILF